MKTKFRYYNSGGILGVIGLDTTDITHEEGEYSHISGRAIEWSWIKTSDLYDTIQEAENATVATYKWYDDKIKSKNYDNDNDELLDAYYNFSFK